MTTTIVILNVVLALAVLLVICGGLAWTVLSQPGTRPAFPARGASPGAHARSRRALARWTSVRPA